jgi:hypothetical protein
MSDVLAGCVHTVTQSALPISSNSEISPGSDCQHMHGARRGAEPALCSPRQPTPVLSVPGRFGHTPRARSD